MTLASQSNRHDIVQISQAGGVAESAAAAMLGINRSTLTKARRAGFAGWPAAPQWWRPLTRLGRPHQRLIAYAAADIAILREIFARESQFAN